MENILAIEKCLFNSRDRWYHAPYDAVISQYEFEKDIFIGDHLGGFDANFDNSILDHIHNFTKDKITISVNYKFDNKIVEKYPKLNFKYVTWGKNYDCLMQYKIHPDIRFSNFCCSFNGTPHVSRQLLTSVLQKNGWFDPEYCSKNFLTETEAVQGHMQKFNLSETDLRMYRKFFAVDEAFSKTKFSFGHDRFRFDHANNIFNLEKKLTSSFIHVVSESLATSYYPFVTEKFLYSVVTRGLYLAYAQPYWHDYLEHYYGFKPYDDIFDYNFDKEKNPIKRLIYLTTMISKFSHLSIDDWHDLYQMQTDTIEYNYHHYHSGNWLQALETNV